MKYSEAKKQIEALSSKYSVHMDSLSGYFNINYKKNEVAFVDSDKRYVVGVWDIKDFSKLPFNNKLYMVLSELSMTPPEKRHEEKKYFIHVFSGNYGYLNMVKNEPLIDDIREATGFNIKARFTNREIQQLKQRKDIPLDWDNVEVEEADEN